MEARFFEKFDLAQYLSGGGSREGVAMALREMPKYLGPINKTLIYPYDSSSDEKFMELEEIVARVWHRYISPCIDWVAGTLIETVKQVDPKYSSLSKRPNRNIIAVMDRPAEQRVGDSDINAVMFALVKREPTCPMIGTSVDVRCLGDYVKEQKLILPQDRTSSDIYRAPEDSAKIWQECVDQMFSAVFNDAEPNMVKHKSGELTIGVCGDEEIMEAFNNAKNKFAPPEYREKIRIFKRDI